MQNISQTEPGLHHLLHTTNIVQHLGRACRGREQMLVFGQAPALGCVRGYVAEQNTQA